MRRSNFRRESGGVMQGKLELPSPTVLSLPHHAIAQIKKIEDCVEAQMAVSDRMEAAVAKMRDVMISFHHRLEDKSSGLSKQIESELESKTSELKREFLAQLSSLKASVVAVGGALKSHIETVSKDLHGSLDPRGDFDTLSKEIDAVKQGLQALTGLKTIIGGQQKQAATLATSEQKVNEVLSCLANVEARLASLAKQKPAKSSSKGGDVVLAEVMAYANAEKRVVRDNDGNIVGWKLAGLH